MSEYGFSRIVLIFPGVMLNLFQHPNRQVHRNACWPTNLLFSVWYADHRRHNAA